MEFEVEVEEGDGEMEEVEEEVEVAGGLRVPLLRERVDSPLDLIIAPPPLPPLLIELAANI